MSTPVPIGVSAPVPDAVSGGASARVSGGASEAVSAPVHTVAVLALPGVVAFDLGVPCQVFASAYSPGGTPLYRVLVCGPGEVTATAVGVACFRLSPGHPLADAASADTVVVPGLTRGAPEVTPEVLDVLRTAARRGARVLSICTGAFVLAAAGLLDGRRATTHWRMTGELARAYPLVEVEAKALYVDTGQILTSAGVAAGLDLCVHVVLNDHGPAVAANVARGVVMAPEREGGQAQFVRHPSPAPGGADLGPTLRWAREHMHLPLTLADIARQANTSVRNLNRRFQDQVGTTPLRWLLRARVDRARELLESTNLPVERVAERCGFGSPASFRARFAQRAGVSPSAYRAAFRFRENARGNIQDAP
ncbi:GlxA family transcriptional regulator [Streptosporangium jomthongense]|uniref:GlxA family transcriptional regulator n=1 Tax=Streptosporangium jomthongense TaxID=1193683 RepID=A0ABV8EWP5_9ACTN